MDCDRLAAEIGIAADEIAESIEQISTDVHLRRRGVEAKLVVGDAPALPDPVLLRILRDAHFWTAALRDGVPLGDITRDAGHHDVYIRTRGQLAFLSPRIQRAIADGTINPEITLQHLMTVTLPLDWQDQERLCHLA